LGLFFFSFMQSSCNKNNLTENNSQITTHQKNSNIKESDVPAGVKDKFNQLYPSTNVKAWDVIDGNYLAYFTYNNNSMTVLFAATGAVIETATEITESQLPKSCVDYCTKYYGSKNIKSPYRVVDAAGRVFYQLEVDKNLILFDAVGIFVRIIS
jgi:hypothetical protein